MFILRNFISFGVPLRSISYSRIHSLIHMMIYVNFIVLEFLLETSLIMFILYIVYSYHQTFFILGGLLLNCSNSLLLLYCCFLLVQLHGTTFTLLLFMNWDYSMMLHLSVGTAYMLLFWNIFKFDKNLNIYNLKLKTVSYNNLCESKITKLLKTDQIFEYNIV